MRAAAFGQTRNDCEPVVRGRYGEVAAALDWLDAQLEPHDAHNGARLTGTGACIFASFEREQDARRIAQAVPEKWSGFVARGVERSPAHEQLERE
jgi:4-diphosphocytidyl-2-C-methyl-D-erythritol kinase